MNAYEEARREQREFQALEDKLEAALAQVQAAEEREAALRYALQNYGWHKGPCPARTDWRSECDCGFWAALSQAPEEAKE